MSKVSIWNAKTNLSKLIQDALNGEEVVIANREKPLVKLVPVEEQSSEKLLGLFRGKVWISKGFKEIPEGFEDYT